MNEEVLNKIKEILGEHYPNYCIIALDEEGRVYSDYTSVQVGRMLLTEAQRDFTNANELVNWDWEEMEDDFDG